MRHSSKNAKQTKKSGPRETVELEVTSLTHGGSGVAHIEIKGERRAVFVERSAPGDRAELLVDFSARPARGTITQLSTRSPHRIDSPCPVSETCGGCDFMHLNPEYAFAALTDLVRTALPEAYRGAPVSTHRSPVHLGYRSRVRVHVSAKRGSVDIGMHAARSHAIVTTDACVVLEPTIDEARRELGPLLADCELTGEASLALGAFDSEGTQKPVCDLSFRGELAPSFFKNAEAAVARGRFAGIRAYDPDSKRPLEIGDSTPWITGADGQPMKLGKGGFAQANLAVNRELAARVVELAKSVIPLESTVLELYAGAGNLSVMLAPHYALPSIESSEEACQSARENLAARGLRAKVTAGDAATLKLPPGTGLVVLDPPRTGAREVATQLAQMSRPPAVLYVSCDAPSLGRDLAILEAAGFQMLHIDTFEMFPRTSHVETLVLLKKPRK